MYELILLTLDGSPLAELAVPHAVALARAFGARLELLGVVPVSHEQALVQGAAGVGGEAQRTEAGDYLTSIVSQLRDEGLEANWTVRMGNVAQEILDHAEACDADLLVLSSHGRSGLGRWVYGSVADRVLRHATIPVLLVRATE